MHIVSLCLNLVIDNLYLLSTELKDENKEKRGQEWPNQKVTKEFIVECKSTLFKEVCDTSQNCILQYNRLVIVDCSNKIEFEQMAKIQCLVPTGDCNFDNAIIGTAHQRFRH